MDSLLRIIGNSAAVLGILICLVAGVSRLLGGFYLFGFETGAFFSGGIALMVMACLVKLQLLAVRK
jgi:hypothetical protein